MLPSEEVQVSLVCHILTLRRCLQTCRWHGSVNTDLRLAGLDWNISITSVQSCIAFEMRNFTVMKAEVFALIREYRYQSGAVNYSVRYCPADRVYWIFFFSLILMEFTQVLRTESFM